MVEPFTWPGDSIYLFAGLAALLALAVLIMVLPSREAPREGGAPPIPFRPEWLARVPADVRRIPARRTSRWFLTVDLLAECTSECCSGVRKAIDRIRR